MLAAISLGAVGVGARPASRAGFDFGNAPDGTPTFYAGGVIGRFPSFLRSNGARADVGDALRLGVRLDAERDAKVLAGELDNDGVFLETFQACNRVVLSAAVSLDRPAPAGGRAVFLNFWADWDLDGRWEGGDRCQSEHPVRDARLVVPAGTRVVIFRLTFRAGAKPPPLWTRTILSSSPLRRESPTGRVGPGEVEDDSLRPLPPDDCLGDLLGHGRKGYGLLSVDPDLLPLKRTVVDSEMLPRWTAKRVYPGPKPPLDIVFTSLKDDVDTPGGVPYFAPWGVNGRIEPERGAPVKFFCLFTVAHKVPTVLIRVAPPGAGTPAPPPPPSGKKVIDTGIAVKGSWYVGAVSGRPGGGTGAMDFRVSADGKRLEDMRFNTSFTCDKGITSDLFRFGSTTFALQTKTEPIPGRADAVQRLQAVSLAGTVNVTKSTPTLTTVPAQVQLELAFSNQGQRFTGTLSLTFTDPNLGACKTGTLQLAGSPSSKPVFPR